MVKKVKAELGWAEDDLVKVINSAGNEVKKRDKMLGELSKATEMHFTFQRVAFGG